MKLINRKLGDGIHIKHGFAFLGEYFSDQGKYILLTPGNFYEEGGFKSRPEKDRYYIGTFPSDYLLKKHDLIVAMTEQGPGLLGSSAFIPEDNTYLHNQRLGLVDKIDKELFDKKYLYNLFNSRGVRSQIYGSATGTKVRHTSPGRIYKVKVLVPDVVKQKEISSIIENYSQLIDANRRRIQLLEESARLLFREWFVYFRFPGHEKVKIADGVPEGWKNSTVKDCVSFISRGPSLDYISEGEDDGVPVLNQRCVRNGEIELDSVEYAKELSLKQKVLYLKEFDILINSMGEGTLGRVSRNLSIKYPMIVHNCITVIRANEKIINQTILFYRLSTAQTYLETMGLGSTGQTSLKKEVIERIKTLMPPEELREQFDSIVKPIWLEVGALKIQNQRLAQARDLLLPRLMNGTIQV